MIDFLGTIVTTALIAMIASAVVVYLEIGRSAKLALAATCELLIGLVAAASASGWLTISDPFSDHRNFRRGAACRSGNRGSLAGSARGGYCVGDRCGAIYLARAARSTACPSTAAAARPAQLSVHWFGILVPGVLSLELSAAFAHPTAYGDPLAAVLALLALAGLRTQSGLLLVCVFNLWGTADLFYAFYQGNSVRDATRSVRCGFFHTNRHCAVAPDHAWACIPAPVAERTSDRVA